MDSPERSFPFCPPLGPSREGRSHPIYKYGALREVMPGMDMSLLSSINESQQAATNVRIGTAVMAKVLNTTSDLQMDMVNKLLGESGIGQNINIVA
jgi:hypothetical protein